MPSQKERRAAYEYTKSLNKPGRVGTFAEEERNRKVDERQERKQRATTQRQDVRLPGAAILITVGLLVLYLAATGNLKKIGQAWDFILGKTSNLPTSGVANNPLAASTGIMDFSNYHVETHLAQPVLSAHQPGGFN